MIRALELAKLSSEKGEVPIGAVIVYNDKIIGESSNLVEQKNNSIKHAEIIAIENAIENYNHKHLLDTQIYISLEPCSMCAGAIVLARIPNVFIAAKDPKTGAGGSVLNILENESLNHRANVEYGCLEEESSKMLKDFFKNLRKSK